MVNSAETPVTTASLNTITTEDPNVNIEYTGAALTTENDVKRINAVFAKNNSGLNTGELKVALNTSAANLALLSSNMTGNAKALDIEITTAIGNDAFGTLDGKTSVALAFSGAGKIQDSSGNLTKAGNLRSDELSAAITQDSAVTIDITGGAITNTNGDFTKLNNVASGTAGAITASVTGTGGDLATLSNLSTNDVITFVVNAHSTNTKDNITTISGYTDGATLIDVCLLYTSDAADD